MLLPYGIIGCLLCFPPTVPVVGLVGLIINNQKLNVHPWNVPEIEGSDFLLVTSSSVV